MSEESKKKKKLAEARRIIKEKMRSVREKYNDNLRTHVAKLMKELNIKKMPKRYTKLLENKKESRKSIKVKKQFKEEIIKIEKKIKSKTVFPNPENDIDVLIPKSKEGVEYHFNKTSKKFPKGFSKYISENKKIILLLIREPNYFDFSVELVKSLSKKSLIYITLNKTYNSIKEIFSKTNITMKNIVFIDAITNTFRSTPKREDNCLYVSSPSSLTEISIILRKLLKHNIYCMVFDSLDSLLIYNNETSVMRFVSSLLNKINNSTAKAIFYALDIPEHKSFIKKTSIAFDKVIKI